MSEELSTSPINDTPSIKTILQHTNTPIVSTNLDFTRENISLLSKLYRSVANWDFYLYVLARIQDLLVLYPLVGYLFGYILLTDCLINMGDGFMYVFIMAFLLELVKMILTLLIPELKDCKRLFDVVSLVFTIYGYKVVLSGDYIVSNYMRSLK